MSNELKEREWFLSGGNGVITLAESGSTEPITYLRPEQKANAGYIVERHNATIRSLQAEVERLKNDFDELRAESQVLKALKDRTGHPNRVADIGD